MRLRAISWFLLPILFSIALELPPVFAQSPIDAELKALNSRVIELYEPANMAKQSPGRAICSRNGSALWRERARICYRLNNLAQRLQATIGLPRPSL